MPTRARYQISLKLILTNEQGEVLALRAVPTGTFAGYYDLPGGRINTGEFQTPLVAILKREVSEELGKGVRLRINPKPVSVGRHLLLAKYTSAGSDIPVLYLFFKAQYLGGRFNTSAEHTGWRWLKLSRTNARKYFTSGILEGIRMYVQTDNKSRVGMRDLNLNRLPRPLNSV